MPLSTCSVCLTPIPLGNSRCAKHSAQSSRNKKVSSSKRGYGYAHQKLRAQYQSDIDKGIIYVCPKCNKPILPKQQWDLGHDKDRTRYLGPEHYRCNRATNKRLAR